MANEEIIKVEEPKQPKPKKSVGHIVLEIVEWVIIALAVVFVAFVFVFASKSPTGNKSSSLFGYETLLVTSGSMEGEPEFYQGKNYKIGRLNTGTLIFIKSTPGQNEQLTPEGEYTEKFQNYLNNIKVGDVVTFIKTSAPLELVTHRVINIESVQVSGHTKVEYTTQGDANLVPDNKFYAENLEGYVIGNNDALGWLYVNVFSNKAIVATIIIVPCAAIIIYEGVKIFLICKKDKQEKLALEANKEPEDEIAELEKKLEELKKKSNKDKK